MEEADKVLKQLEFNNSAVTKLRRHFGRLPTATDRGGPASMQTPVKATSDSSAGDGAGAATEVIPVDSSPRSQAATSKVEERLAKLRMIPRELSNGWPAVQGEIKGPLAKVMVNLIETSFDLAGYFSVENIDDGGVVITVVQPEFGTVWNGRKASNKHNVDMTLGFTADNITERDLTIMEEQAAKVSTNFRGQV